MFYRRVADSFTARSHNLIKLPTEREMERLARKLDARFPGLRDCPMGIDGTQIEYAQRLTKMLVHGCESFVTALA